ncbi:copper resistance D family protein [Salsuginibacillus kocurii]|uniref:copper resistance D family protein n=1 Tax=Salsuginibacillus kocurii TaxID=427078 RepID=UPI0003813572|nr:CopD family protein [Salsuginibacillus kocurii]
MLAVVDGLLFLATAMVAGIVILFSISQSKYPQLTLPNGLFYSCIGMVIVLASIPVVSQVAHIMNMFDSPFSQTISTILTDYRMGQGWLAVILGGVMLTAFKAALKKKDHLWHAVCLLPSLVLTIAGVAWMSHAASIAQTGGFLADFMHLLAALSWAGLLFTVAFFCKNDSNLASFFSWFHWFALVAVSLIVFSGLILMQYIVPEYRNSWMLSYGQWLLLKHLLFIPLIFYGFIHGFIVKKRLNKGWNASRFVQSLRIESVLIIGIFFVTAVMSQQTPPHEVAQTLQFAQPSGLAQLFIGEQLLPGAQVEWLMTIGAVSFFFAALATFLFLVWLVFKTRQHAVLMPLVLAVFSALSYGTVMAGASATGGSVDQNAYTSVEDAVLTEREEDEDIEILDVIPYGEGFQTAIYTVNEEDLVAELFMEKDETFYALPDSTLTIGGTPVTESDHTIRTFLIDDGIWQQPGSNYTYVTVGHVQDPENVAEVHVYYEDELHEVETTNNVFFTSASSEYIWNENHPFEFFNENGEEVGGYMRTMMEEGAFCH